MGAVSIRSAGFPAPPASPRRRREEVAVGAAQPEEAAEVPGVGAGYRGQML